jgi:zinc/manganese transport system substrate-binding protein
MKNSLAVLLSLTLFFSMFVSSCQSGAGATGGKKSIVVTYSVLGVVVRELVGDKANVTISIPNGLDPHEWEPSAKDIEAINKADLVVQNGLGLEGGMEKTLEQARANGVKFFTASDHITVRHVGAGEGIPTGDPDQAVGAPDPHLWMDPIAVKTVVVALSDELKKDFNLDVSAPAQDLAVRFVTLNAEVTQMVAVVPSDNRKLVTGHESMGYFAARYGFKLVGVIIPSLTTQAEVSAADLAALKQTIVGNKVKAMFTELGTPQAVADAIGRETGVKVIELSTHVLPGDGSYFTFMRNIATTVTETLK